VAVLGKDRPGIVREVSGALASLGATILSLSTQTRDTPMGDGVIFEADADVWLPLNVTPEAVQLSIEALSHDVVVDLTEAEDQ
jgi:glycine cleavage system regulatory protein